MVVISPSKGLLEVSRETAPSYVVTPVEIVVSTGDVSGVTDEDANVLRSTSSTIRTSKKISVEIGRDVTFSTLDPSIGTVSSDGTVGWVSDGTARIFAASSYDMQRFDVPVAQIAGEFTDTLVSWVDGTVAKEASDNIENAISGKTPSAATLNIFSSFDHASGYYVRSGSVWCAGYQGALTACNAWQSNYGTGQSRAQTAITSRHIVGAGHYTEPVTIGGTVRFVAEDGTVVDRTVTHTKRIGSTDIQISLLSSDLPASIFPASILPSNWGDYMRNINLQIPCLIRNQFGEARIYDIKSLTDSVATFTDDMPSSRSDWYRPLVVGDSGGPSFMLVDNSLVLLSTWTSAINGPSYHAVDWPSEITALDLLAGVSTGLSPSVVDLSGFNNFNPANILRNADSAMIKNADGDAIQYLN